MSYDAQGLLWAAFDHPVIAIAVIFAAYLALFHFAPAFALSLGAKAIGWLKSLVGLFASAGKGAVEAVQTGAAASLGGDPATAALTSAQNVIAYAVQHGDAQTLTTAVAILPELQKAAKKAAPLLLLALLVGCSEPQEVTPGPTGWIEPPTPEQQLLYGEEPALTLSQKAPHLLETDPQQ